MKLITLASILAAPSAALGKCAAVTYLVSGTVESAGSPDASIRVCAFLGDQEYGTCSPVDDGGNYEVMSRWSTYSVGFLGMDRCNKRPKQLRLVFSAAEGPAREVKFRLKRSDSKWVNGGYRFDVPQLVLWWPLAPRDSSAPDPDPEIEVHEKSADCC